MPLHHDFLTRSRAVRPKIIKLARQGRLVDTAFKEFQRACFPGAPADQVHIMRICFFAGASELHALITYASDTATDDATDEDIRLWTNIIEEIERFHEFTIKASGADPQSQQ